MAYISVIIVEKYVMKGKQTMKNLNIVPQKQFLRMIGFSDIVPTLFLFLVSRSGVMGMYPFAAAFFAAVYDKKIAYMGIVTACIAVASSAGVAAVPKYMIILTAYWLFTKLFKNKNNVIASVAVGVCVLIGGSVMLLTGYNGLFDLFLSLTESITASLMYIIFGKTKAITADFERRCGMTSDDYISAAITVGVILSGFDVLTYRDISVTHILASYILLFTALNTSVSVSACTGVCIGFMSSMGIGGAVVMMGVYGFGAMFASFMNSYKKVGCFIGYICAMTVMMIYAQNIYKIPAGALNAFLGGVMFFTTPKTVDGYIHSFFTKSIHIEKVSPVSRMREYLSMRLVAMGEAFESLHESFFSMTEGRLKKYSDDVGEILDETADRVCKDCKKCGKCWQADFRKTYKNMLELIGTIEHDGWLTVENVPENFGKHCERSENFIYEINHVYELYKRDIIRRSDAVVTRNLISMQYREINKLFLDMAGDINDGFDFMEDEEEKIVNVLDKQGIVPYEISVIESDSGVVEAYLRLPPKVSHNVVEGAISEVLGRNVVYEKTEKGLSKYGSGAIYAVESSLLQVQRDGFGVNGDSVAIFTVGERKFYVIIADGMGSGAEAQYESACALRLLTSFLKSGFCIKTAFGILNSSMCLNMDNEVYSTIDLLCIDLYSGEAQMYKIGGAQTLFLNAGEVKTITSSSLPVGILSDIQPDKKTVMLKEGDVIVMMSDGITESGCSLSKTEWIRKTMIKPFETTDELAKAIMDTAMEKNNGAARDDMSVVAMRFFEK